MATNRRHGERTVHERKTQRDWRAQAKTLSAKTIQQTHVPLDQALNLAVEWGMISINPAVWVPLPQLSSTIRRF